MSMQILSRSLLIGLIFTGSVSGPAPPPVLLPADAMLSPIDSPVRAVHVPGRPPCPGCAVAPASAWGVLDHQSAAGDLYRSLTNYRLRRGRDAPLAGEGHTGSRGSPVQGEVACQVGIWTTGIDGNTMTNNIVSGLAGDGDRHGRQELEHAEGIPVLRYEWRSMASLVLGTLNTLLRNTVDGSGRAGLNVAGQIPYVGPNSNAAAAARHGAGQHRAGKCSDQ